MHLRISDFMKGLSRIVLRHAVWVSLVGSLLAVLGTFFTFQLYKNLRTNLEELLPTTARSVLDLERVGKRLSSVENIVVVVFSANKVESKRFVVDLAQALEKLPKEIIAGVEYKIDQDRDFFQKRLPLFLDLEDLVQLRDYAKKVVSYKSDLLGLGLVEKPFLDFDKLTHKYQAKSQGLDRFPDGYFATSDETKRLVIVNMAGKAADIDAALRLKGAVENTILSLRPQTYAADLEIHYTGNLQNLIDEHKALVADLKFSTLVVILLVTALMLLFYRAFWATQALVISLFMGTFWTFGLSYFLVGYLNANSAFLASIVIGNGINFGIIFLARYLEELRRGRSNTRAIIISMKTTAPSTFTAALAAGLSYGSLILTGFRGFSQFGIIGFVGMTLCWLSAYTLLPSFLTLLAKRQGLASKGKSLPKPIISEALADLVELHPRRITGISFALLVIAGLSFFVHRPEMIEMDMNKLRDKDSMERGSGFYYHYISDIFGRNISPMILLADSRIHAREIARNLSQKKESEGANSLIGWVQSIDDFVPPDQEKKIGVLKDIRQILTPSVLKKLPKDERAWAGRLVEGATLTPFSETELPPLMLSKFTEADGTVGRSVLVDKQVVPQGTEENALKTISFIEEIRDVTDRISPNTAIAGQLPITADMISAILRDGPRATVFAAVAVFFLVVILFHRFRTIALVTFGLWMGVSWLVGIIFGMHLKINFLNFIALPITFGIGVDYAVNIFQRYREEGAGCISNVIRQTGTAVGLCSLTTIIGYSSLLLAGNQAIKSFGMLAVFGEICCVTAAIVSLPAFLSIRKTQVSS